MAAKHELYVIRGKTLDTIADNVRTVLGIDPDEPIRFDETTLNNTTQANGDIDAQADLIAQIKTALEGKAAGSGGTEELENLIDQSEVLDSTEGTVKDKVGELIEYTQAFNHLMQMSFANNEEIEHINFYIDSPLLGHNGFFRNTLNLKYVEGVNLSKTTDMRWFASGSGVEIIKRPLNVSTITNKTYMGGAFACAKLKEIRFVAECIKVSVDFVYASLLSAESVQSIFDGLSSTATGQTLTLPSVFKNADGTSNTEAEAVVSANIEVVDGVTRIKGKEGWTLVR